MKKRAVGLVIAGVLAGEAWAQSSVVIFGKLDQAVGKPVGTANRQVLDTAGSRIAFRAVEDLGGGMQAIFAIEHRFSPDTGAAATPTVFWDGFSYVGLRAQGFGALTLGRQYTSGFLTVQNQIDPFAGETVAALRTILMGGGYGTADAPQNAANTWAGAPTGLGPTKGRVNDSIKYANIIGPVTVSADIAEVPPGGVDRPYSMAAAYAGGPLWLGVAFENAAGEHDRGLNLGARWNFGPAAVSAGFTDGRINTATNNKLRAWLLGVLVPVGVGDIKAGYATSKVAGVVRNERLGLGYHHNLSKRTKLYADVAHEGTGLAANKTGYDLGIQHQY